ncbi:MAG: prepilin-type N-terminal cleavage/methylation domain-containing protein [Verrucomicrobia bacterium]|nr:prepilin-type N-terminal cleavage/methylation domain-containing protein [Verrucomicrobiota bacterium]MDA1086199.1 prepilin-type N-terminal cleavage/methylation domain-containing protein [Verrucomicrobiota bacterium]
MINTRFRPWFRRQRAFTLVEMLVVAALILILGALLFPAIQRAIQQARRHRARTEVNQIATAWRQFKNEYATFPSGITEMDANALSILRGVNDVGGQYKRKLLLLENAPGSGEWFDPWGLHYFVELDLDYDNVIDLDKGDGKTNTVYGGVAVWSKGRDNGLDDTTDDPADDINNWKQK